MDPADVTDRLDTLTSWHSDWAGLRVGVLGLGKTGFSVADTLAELGARVLVVAQRAAESQIQLVDVIGASLVLDERLDGPPEALVELDPEVLVVSPGFHPDHPVLAWAESRGVAIWGDVELAWRLRDKVGTPAEWIAITGTNGKTTTTQLTATMLVEGGLRAAPCGNIGIPILDAIRDPQGFDVLVVELSSYQLHSTSSMSPYASVCLNVAEDHLDWHGSMQAYVEAKARVYTNTRVACVYNRSDARTLAMVENAEVVEGCRAIGFGLGVPGLSDFGVVDGILCDRAFTDDRRISALEITTVADLAAHGLAAPHMVANVLAAAALARSFGVSIEAVRRALFRFELDHHRIETVATANGVQWVNDSKATNAHAADASLGAFESVVWIAGGLLKGVDVGPLVAARSGRLRAAVLIGADRTELRLAFQRHAPGVPVFEVSGTETEDDTGIDGSTRVEVGSGAGDGTSAESVMSAAVRLAASVAEPGDVVLLAPAGASMDQFVDYNDRGAQFARAVNDYLGGERS
ncbi:UDP-N-acetylmuramoyl-L-alanine--D-glutamate ligase [Subtercola sp. PAMC28395]|uniref:UDP-N-acetylmuramoyl-L-alanine--D-glutamate ligase n=1 Tax=Subtercola sp. PAMC28395 TaxID=2846775 RepID=UPI001C0CC0D5|nr:UDP-N-acetylmuramoyl-L-alanine--D-glutamate ligase [Subtercola sp. PAMC28395]QWT23172.1 UDP-N-acetylmuramoyl-L-alanine--D-glutamate ligase [Subtercola sp. PAMC28395]